MNPGSISHTALLGTNLKRLRRGFALRRSLEILTVALAADFSLDLIALFTSLSFNWTFHVPFFFESILLVLLVRETFRLRWDAFALFLDRTFGLKDRVYSYYGFAAPQARVPLDIRESQAAECLGGIDFSAMRKRLKPRVPPLLVVLAPVFLWIVYSSLNTDYIPPGTVSRTAIKLISPDSWEEHERSERAASSRRDRDREAAARTSPDDDAPGNASSGQPERSASEGDGTDEERKGPPVAEGGEEGKNGVDARQAASEKTDDPEAHGMGKDPENRGGSQLETDQVTEPGSEGYRDGTDTQPERLKDPTHLLNLLPLPEREAAAGVESLILKMAGQKLENYPVRYRTHINRYFEELTKWQKDQTPNSTRN